MSDVLVSEYQGYCDICKHGSPWYPVPSKAKGWRDLHFEDQHPDNPMKKTNCRIKRRKVEPEKQEDDSVEVALDV